VSRASTTSMPSGPPAAVPRSVRPPVTVRARLLPLPCPETDASIRSGATRDLPVIAQKHPTIPGFNAAWRPRSLPNRQAAGNRVQTPRYAAPPPRLVWVIAGLSDLPLYNFSL
jgi:hypothetical protein